MAGGCTQYSATIQSLQATYHEVRRREESLTNERATEIRSHVREFFCDPVLVANQDRAIACCYKASKARRSDVMQTMTAAIQRARFDALPERRRRNLNPRATRVLTVWFETNEACPYPTDDDKEQLALLSGVSVDQVSNWFSNRRNRKDRRAAEHSRR